MAFKVNKFIAHFDSHAGFARTSKFEVRIGIPQILLGAGTTEELSLQCEAAELPGYTVNTVESKIFGAPTHLAGTPAFGDISLTFICAGDLWEKKFFDTWFEAIIPKSTYLVNYKQDYQTTITVHQYSDYVNSGTIARDLKAYSPTTTSNFTELQNIQDRAAQNLGLNPNSRTSSTPDLVQPIEIFACKLINAFPVSVNPLPLNWATDDIHRLNVTFKYDKWINVKQNNPTNLPPTKPIAGTDGAQQRTTRGSSVPAFPSSFNTFKI